MRERQRAKPAPDQPNARAGVIKRGDSYADLRGHAEAQRNSKKTVTRLKIKLEPGRYEPLPAQVMVAASLLETGTRPRQPHWHVRLPSSGKSRSVPARSALTTLAAYAR